MHVGPLVERGVVGPDRGGYGLDVQEEEPVEQRDAAAGPGGSS